MSAFYDDMRATTLGLLTEFGKTVELIRVSNDVGDYDPVTGTFPPAPDTILTGKGVLLDYLANEINGTSILSTDRKMLYQGDALLVDDKYNNWRVFALDNLDPDESGTILVTAQMRK